MYIDNAFSSSQVNEWVKRRFREGHDSCGDDRCEPPMISFNDSDITHVSQIIEDDPHSTVEAVAMKVGFSDDYDSISGYSKGISLMGVP